MLKTICIIDDHEIIRTGIKKIINATSKFTVAYEFESNRQLLNASIANKVDLIIQDLDLENGCDLSQIDQIKRKIPNTPILIYTIHSEAIYGLACLKYDIAGYLTKDKPVNELVLAITMITKGQRYFTKEFNSILTSYYIKRPIFEISDLSQREYEVFVLIGEGFKLSEISRKLFINPRTVSVYRKRILNKLNLDSTGQIIHFYLTNKIKGK